MKLGIHAGPQDLSMEELKRLWSIGDSKGFHLSLIHISEPTRLLSIWDCGVWV